MSKQPRATECDVCGHMLKKTYKDTTKIHACTPCNTFIFLMETRAKRMFGE